MTGPDMQEYKDRLGMGAYTALSQKLGGTGSLRGPGDSGYSPVQADQISDMLRDACDEFEQGFVLSWHSDRYTLCDELAGHYMKLYEIHPFADDADDTAVRDAYVSAALSAKGLELDLSDIYDGDMSFGARGRLADEMGARLEISDPEIASAWIEDLGDGVRRDGYGRALNRQTGRPNATEYASLALASPGAYLNRMRDDNARIEQKRRDVFRDAMDGIVQPAVPAPVTKGPAHVEPDKKPSMWDRLKGMLEHPDDSMARQDDGPER